MLIPANRVESTLAVAFTQGTSTEIALASVANCPAKSVVYIDDDVEWCLVKYGLLDVPNKKLKTLTNPLAVYQSSGANGHEFPIGTEVCVAAGADVVEQLLLKSATDKTISGGVITVDSTRRVAAYLVDTEGAAGSDDLDTINGGAEGLLILLRAKDAAHTVVAKHNTGNVLTAGADISLDDTDLYILLAYDTALTKWVVVGGGGGGSDTPWTVNHDAAGYDVADLGVLNFDDATELTISVAETERLASEVAWTQVDGNCTVTEDEDDPDAGAEHSAKMAMAAGAAVGLQAYEDLGAGADLTGSSRIRVWIRVLTDDIAEGDFQLVIDNTAACASPIQHCDLPAQTVAANWVEVDIPYNPTLANMDDVNSFGLYMAVDKTCEILIHELRTIVGSVARTQSYHKIDAEDGSAAKTVLDAINGLVAGDELFIRAESGDRTVVLRSDTGNILLPGGGEYSLNDAIRTAALICDGTNWRLHALEGMITQAKARIYRATNQDDILDDTWTKVLLDTAAYDPSSMFASYKLTFKVSGYYAILGKILYVGASVVANKIYGVGFYKNDARISETLIHSSIVDYLSVTTQDFQHFAVGDYLELWCYHNAGVGTIVVQGGTLLTFIAVHLLSAD